MAIAHPLRSSFFFSSIALRALALSTLLPVSRTELSQMRVKSLSTALLRSTFRILRPTAGGSRLDRGRLYGLSGVTLLI